VIPSLDRFRTFVFDCDGVVLDSNELKTRVFHEVASRFGGAAAERLVDHHRAHGGVSRHEKFRWFVAEVLGRPRDAGLVDDLVDGFGRGVRRALEGCPTCPGAVEALARCAELGPCFLVSGGLEEELRQVFRARGLDRHFRGIHGSPETKHRIMAGLATRGHLGGETVCFGDSRLDREVARDFGCEFVFLARCTEMADWKAWVESEAIDWGLDLAEVLAAQRRDLRAEVAGGEPWGRSAGGSSSREMP